MNKEKIMKRLFERLDKSTCNFMAVKTCKEELIANGFKELKESEKWQIKPGGKYFLVKNDTAIFSFLVGNGINRDKHKFRIISAHSDSPCFKVKPNPEIYGESGLLSLNVEKYGGGINFTWFDRPLSVSGRVTTKGEDPLHPATRLFDSRLPIATIPNLAIHFNRKVNDEFSTSVQKDMKPVVGYFSREEIEESTKRGGMFKVILSKFLNMEPEDIISYEACLYPSEEAAFCGYGNEFFQSGRIDDLSMAFAGLEALLSVKDIECDDTRILAIFDNEETGSGTKQGAGSPVLRNIMERICIVNDRSREDFLRSVSQSFMISADDAHAWHPNYSEKYDPTNHPVIGGGPVIKINANCKYMTDADGAAVFENLCSLCGVVPQYFVNHSDVAGGSTLGNILSSSLDIRGVDVGCAIWGMHSARETAGTEDHLDMIKVFETFWKCR